MAAVPAVATAKRPPAAPPDAPAGSSAEEWSWAPRLAAPQAVKRVILVRHAQSIANTDHQVYTYTPDWCIPLTQRGWQQARALGRKLRCVVGDSPLFWYVSPFVRTRQTYQGMMQGLGKDAHVASATEEPRVTEMQFANYQPPRQMNYFFGLRQLFGRFFYQFPRGESSLHVHQRVCSFIQSLNFDSERLSSRGVRDASVVVVTHGITLRSFLLRWFRMGVREFDRMLVPRNCAMVVLERQADNRYWLDSVSAKTVTFPRANSGPPPWKDAVAAIAAQEKAREGGGQRRAGSAG
eukprot:TRINITY_DN16387_c0_g1_i1.p1 TRINITY_DN16387_c0_g1~~TRINITY_DN16387_c0_g1_i1.p1  ORF type:complete len:307 (+),score=118.24 TRINITY_DN16387_c0_g1_i1:41-922(+)